MKRSNIYLMALGIQKDGKDATRNANFMTLERIH